jgi:phage FluMu protein Com
MSRKCADDGHFTIYHIKGLKVGCTKNVEKRKLRYKRDTGKIPKMYLLERIPISKGEVFAGDRERYWAIKLGYNHYMHYAHTMTSIRKSAFKGGKVGGFVTMSSEDRSRIGKLAGIACALQGKSGLKHLTFAQRSVTSKRLIQENIAGFSAAGNVKCPHCKLVGNLGIMQAWHFDRCLQNPKLSKANKLARNKMSVNVKIKCPHCNKVGPKPNMKRWHFDNCKYKLNTEAAKDVAKMRR